MKHLGKIDIASAYFKDSISGDWFGVNLDQTYHPASLYKIPTLIAYYKAAEADPNLLNRKVIMNLDQDYEGIRSVDGSKKTVIGQEYTIDELLKYMIKYSDNNAAIFLASNIDKNFLNEVFTDLGLDAPSDKEVKINPKSFGIFFRTPYNSTYLNRKMSEKALELLRDSEFDKGLKAGVSSDTIVAHKFGEYSKVDDAGAIEYRELHDCGIIYLPKNPYLLCVMTRGKEVGDLEGAVSQISKIVYDERVGKI